MEITGKAITVCLPLQQTVKGLLLDGSYKYLKKPLSKVNKKTNLSSAIAHRINHNISLRNSPNVS